MINRVIRSAGFGVLWFCAAPLAAQEWITPEVCAIPATADAAAASATAPATAPATDGQDQARVTAEAGQIANGHGRFWRITGPQGHVSYLWGTLHASDRSILALPPQLTDALASARLLLLESNPVATSRTELEERALQAGVWLAPRDPAYDKSYLDSRLRAWVTARVLALTHAPEAMTRLTDAGLADLLLSDPCEDFTAGVLPIQDHRLYLSAYQAGVPVRGLEPWDAFLSDISQPDRQDTARAIAQVYGAYLNPEGYGAARAASFALYRQGRIAEMQVWNRSYLRGLFGPDKADGLMALADGYMIDERNRTFLRNLAPALDAGGALVAVGAFHLPGDNGLVALLRSAGYRVERVPVAGEVD